MGLRPNWLPRLLPFRDLPLGLLTPSAVLYIFSEQLLVLSLLLIVALLLLF